MLAHVLVPCCRASRSPLPCPGPPPAEHDPSLVTDSPAGSVASSNLSRATAAGGGRGGSSVERLLYKALRALAEQVRAGALGSWGST